MIPYLHLGPLTLPTFGLMVATALLIASYILNADFRRRAIRADAFLVIGIAGLSGIVGARLYHLLESPSEFVADPWPLLISRFGFAWFGGFLGGFAALFLIARGTLAGWFARLKFKELAESLQLGRTSVLEFLDTCSPAAAAGYAIGRIGCFLSGDGDYGIPTTLPWGMSFPNGIVPTSERVHPTPLYEFFVWMLIAYVLWRMGARAIQRTKSVGLVFCSYLVLTGISRFLVEMIRLNPRSFFGMSNAQAASVASVFLGVMLYFFALGKSSRAATSPTAN
jgi:phosphatidylglycerol---prolipoprotein diacylglyceryl transferase